ncbi:MAG: cytochrome c3 family protein [Halodesulfurarchaeum sp.]
MAKRAGLFLVIMLAAVGVAALPVAADLGFAAENGTTPSFDVNQNAQQINCDACHTGKPQSLWPQDKTETCKTCHEETAQQFQNSIHSEETDTHANVECTACHQAPEDTWFMHFREGPHGNQNPGVSMAPENTCAQSGCHGYANKKVIPDGKDSGVTHVNKWHPEYGEWNETEDPGWNSSMVSHSKPMPSYGRECTECHGTHEGVFANIEKAPGVYEYAHDAQPNPENVTEWRITCVVCHEPHSVTAEDPLRGNFEDGSKLCAQCHNAELGSKLQAGNHTEVHHSMWEMYSRSKFYNGSGSHMELECYSCHMPFQARPPGNFSTTEGIARHTGHSFEVNTTALMSDRLQPWTDNYKQCSSCHQSLEATIEAQRSVVQHQLDVASSLRMEANQTVHQYGLTNNTAIMDTLQQGTFWLNFVEAAGTGLHNPEMATQRLTGAIQKFDKVKSMAYKQQVEQLNQQLEEAQQAKTTITPTPTETATPTETPTQTPTETTTTTTTTPGLGIGVALIALVAAALLALRRWT